MRAPGTWRSTSVQSSVADMSPAAAARVVGRPVKLQLRRSDQFSDVGYQPWMEQTIRLAADADGARLRSQDHCSVTFMIFL